MTPAEILALSGPALDAAVHLHVFQRSGAPAAYSSRDGDAMTLIDRLPLFVGRIDPAHPKFDASRPFVAGTLAHEPAVRGDVTALRVTAARPLVALCKAALLLVLHPPKQLAGASTGRRPVTAPAPGALAAQVGRPKLRQSLRPQPAARIHAADTRAPMPQRPQKFVGPTPQPTSGRDA